MFLNKSNNLGGKQFEDSYECYTSEINAVNMANWAPRVEYECVWFNVRNRAYGF